MGTNDDRAELLAGVRAAQQPLQSLDPDAAPDDLAAWREIIGDARVIGIGEAVRGARSASELRRFTHRVVRFAVDELAVRVLVLEQDTPDAGDALDRYVATGRGSAQAALGDCWAPWRTAEVRDVAEWLRSHNARHPHDRVRVVGAISEDELGLSGHVLEWLRHTGGPVIYWGGAAHSAVAPAEDTTYPPRAPPGMSDGARLRRARQRLRLGRLHLRSRRRWRTATTSTTSLRRSATRRRGHARLVPGPAPTRR